jgi:hypothetical protein
MSCQACRLSKVKCVAQTGQDCVRCHRLGLTCLFKASNRGKANKARDVARLGPAVRALIKATEPSGGSQAALVNAEIERTRASDADRCILSWRGHQCQMMMVEQIATREGQAALIRHWLLIGVRSGSCALLGNVLILASKCGLRLDDVAMQIDRSLKPSALQLPPFIDEWLHAPGRMCCVRAQVEGVVEWWPNEAFAAAVGGEDFLRSKLHREHPEAASNPDFLVCAAEVPVWLPSCALPLRQCALLARAPRRVPPCRCSCPAATTPPRRHPFSQPPQAAFSCRHVASV